jgi:hypothetical protein
MCGLPDSKWREGGIFACWNESRTLITPAMPAAVTAWPRFDLMEPIAQ